MRNCPRCHTNEFISGFTAIKNTGRKTNFIACKKCGLRSQAAQDIEQAMTLWEKGIYKTYGKERRLKYAKMSILQSAKNRRDD